MFTIITILIYTDLFSVLGDSNLAKELCDEINSLATLRYNPSNPDEEVTSGGFDIEEWYWDQRKRVYGIIA